MSHSYTTPATACGSDHLVSALGGRMPLNTLENILEPAILRAQLILFGLGAKGTNDFLYEQLHRANDAINVKIQTPENYPERAVETSGLTCASRQAGWLDEGTEPGPRTQMILEPIITVAILGNLARDLYGNGNIDGSEHHTIQDFLGAFSACLVESMDVSPPNSYHPMIEYYETFIRSTNICDGYYEYMVSDLPRNPSNAPKTRAWSAGLHSAAPEDQYGQPRLRIGPLFGGDY